MASVVGRLSFGRMLACRRCLCSLQVKTLSSGVTLNSGVTLSPSHPQVQALLNSLADPDLSKVMMKRAEPLVVPHYKLFTLEQLEQAQQEATEKANSILQIPPILPEREPCGEVLEVDEDLAWAIPHRIIFTETTQHKENELRSIVVRETDGVLRQATWEERDRMCEVFFPLHGRKMWLPKVLTEEGLPIALDRDLHADVLDLVAVQCHPQSSDYHRIHKRVYEDVASRGCYSVLQCTRYFGCLVWHLLTSSCPPRIYPILKDLVKRQLFLNASVLVKLFMLCYPEDQVTKELEAVERELDGVDLVKEFCEHSNLLELLPYFEEGMSEVIAHVN